VTLILPAGSRTKNHKYRLTPHTSKRLFTGVAFLNFTPPLPEDTEMAFGIRPDGAIDVILESETGFVVGLNNKVNIRVSVIEVDPTEDFTPVHEPAEPVEA
jgi:hypothetical protein